MAAKKLRQIFFAGLEYDRKVAAIHHVASHSSRRFDHIFEIGMQLGRAAGQIQSWNGAASEKREHGIDCFAAHHLRARRARFDMAMDTGEIAVTAEIHLQRINRAPGQRRANLANFFTERLHN